MFECEYDYVARFPGIPGYGAACVDDPDPKWRKELSRTISGWIKRGATVERVHRSVAADGLKEYLDERKRRAEAGKQGALL